MGLRRDPKAEIVMFGPRQFYKKHVSEWMPQRAGLSLWITLRKELIQISHTNIKSRRCRAANVTSVKLNGRTPFSHPNQGWEPIRLNLLKHTPFSTDGQAPKLPPKLGPMHVYKSRKIHILGPSFERLRNTYIGLQL